MASTTTSIENSNSAKRLLGKVALVTGGANGIGESIVRLFLKQGAKVCIADIQDDAGNRLAESLLTVGYDVTYRHCNVVVEEDVKQSVDYTVEKFGTLDIMVNNAGILGARYPDIHGFQLSEFDRVFNVNVRGVFSGMKHAARVMVPAKKGVILSTCSVAGVVGGVSVGSHAYTASKHAVLGLTRSAAAELGKHGIRVNCVSPYGIAAGVALSILPEEKRGDEGTIALLRHKFDENANLKGVELTAEDIANAMLFLASDEARYISGSNVVVDGGYSSVRHASKYN